MSNRRKLKPRLRRSVGFRVVNGRNNKFIDCSERGHDEGAVFEGGEGNEVIRFRTDKEDPPASR